MHTGAGQAAQAVLAVERDRLTHQAEQTERLREGDQVRTAVLAALSHDLRTPLTTINRKPSPRKPWQRQPAQRQPAKRQPAQPQPTNDNPKRINSDDTHRKCTMRAAM